MPRKPPASEKRGLLTEYAVFAERSMSQQTTPEIFKGMWTPANLKATFTKAREMAGLDPTKPGHWFVERMFTLKQAFFAGGFRLMGVGSRLQKWLDKNPKAMPLMERVASDAFAEYLLQNNAIVTWMKETSDEGIPAAAVLECEIVKSYKRAFGIPQLIVTAPQCSKPPEGLPDRWRRAMEMGSEMEFVEGNGDFYEAVNSGKSSSGLMRPSLGTALALFAILELLNTADNTGAWEHNNLIRHAKAGHETRYGPNAGSEKNFVKKKGAEAILKKLKTRGAQDMVSNFDIEIAYKFLSAEFFDEKKYAGVMKLLRTWAGAVMELQDEKPSQFVLTQLREEIGLARSRVRDLLERTFNHPEFFEGKPKGEIIKVGWNPFSHMDGKFLIETLRYATGGGYMSPQTAQEVMGLDTILENARMLKAHEEPKKFTPPFEAKQGMASGDTGGRPQEKPNDTQTTQAG